MEGGIGYGLSAALFSEINIDEGGRVRESNFNNYRNLRIHECPEIEVEVVASSDMPTGVGESGLPPLAPALANAWRVLTGQTVCRLPFARSILGENSHHEDCNDARSRHRWAAVRVRIMVPEPTAAAQPHPILRCKPARSRISKRWGRFLRSPRCINCHPSGERPTQGDKMQPHQSPVFRGDGGKGEVGMRCVTCHGPQNYSFVGEQGSIPGVPDWHLASESMAWQNKSLYDICVQLKDPARNGGKTVEQIVGHHEQDPVVRWAWNPGDGRVAAPGTHVDFVKWTRERAANGAHCPNP